MEAYLQDYEARGGKSRRTMKITIDAHILPSLGGRKVADLTADAIRKWHQDLARAPARLRAGPKTKERKLRKPDPTDANALRARRATANRVLTVLKAALNLAFANRKVPSDVEWRTVKPFPKVDAPKVRYLTDPEAVRLVNACPTDVRELVTAALLTGCDYSELATARVADASLEAATLTIRGKRGERHVRLSGEAVKFFANISVSKTSGSLLFTRSDGGPWGRSHQIRPLREACRQAAVVPAVSFHILRHTYATRMLRRGMPMHQVSKQLGHASMTITAKHYAHVIPDDVAQSVRELSGELGIVPESNLAAIPAA